ncbi:MAG TPA: DegT/DnrJ/EryC1/StrS family aminotransferase [Armatimonadota bacterium]|jgi:dTDP-4-amino-4,6-dideoxygalactose transaminase|nr:DegT/DnrJ/EryC1/StrS family aminotransferase [Armatimonadota bacterium]
MPGPGSYWIGTEEMKEVEEVLQSGYLSRYGEFDDPDFKHKVISLEQEFAEYCGVSHALATSSGTGSIMIALLALGLKPGDEVIVPAYTFVATYSAAIFVGLVPVLAEIDESLTLDPEDIEGRITPKTRAIMPVHMLGNPCDMDPIMAVAEKHDLLVVEDACQAAGASYKGRKVGSIGVMGAFSLNVFKTITAGDGGLLTTDDKDLYERSFGIHDQGHKPLRGGLEVGNRSILGLNFRVNELVGAVALAQLRKLDKITATLREKKNRLKDALRGIEGLRFRTLNDSEGECGTLCSVIFDDAATAAEVARRLGTTTVDQSGWHVYANMEHVSNYLKEAGRPYGKGAYPRTDDILSRTINLSVGVVDAGLGAGFGINIDSTDEEIDRVAAEFRAACEAVAVGRSRESTM